jgi:hypothetical protein
MKIVVCINDKNLPPGAEVVEGKEYPVLKEYLNMYDQRVYIIGGVNNDGSTKMGLEWTGYDAKRFADLESTSIEEKETNFALN